MAISAVAATIPRFWPRSNRLPVGHKQCPEHLSKRGPVMAIEFDEHEFMEVERYELRESGTYRFSANRREFVQTLGAGLVIVVSTDVTRAQAPGRRGGGQSARRDEKLSDRFHIAED